MALYSSSNVAIACTCAVVLATAALLLAEPISLKMPAARMPITTITTNSSTNVKPLRKRTEVSFILTAPFSLRQTAGQSSR